MKSIKYILAISILTVTASPQIEACGPYYAENPDHIEIFRSCSPELERQWQEGYRFQDYEKDENCKLWQTITSSSIPLSDIKDVIYSSRMSDLHDLSGEKLAGNQFAQWLSKPEHSEDSEYVLVAKEIEEVRDYMNNPWYYAYDGDEEHARLGELMKRCLAYTGKRHASRYALQMARLYFAKGDFKSCIKLWEDKVSIMQQDIVTDMIASYVGGAYYRCGDRDKAIELFTRSQDIGSLISLKAWNDVEDKSEYTDTRVKQLEYIFNCFPNSPLLSVKLQEYVRARETFVYNFEDWKDRDFHDPVYVKTYWVGDSLVADAEPVFYNELKQFARTVASSPKCRQKGLWQYALGYLYYLDGNTEQALTYLGKADNSDASPFIKESVRAFKFLMDARSTNNSSAYRRKLLAELKWLDNRMKNDVSLRYDSNWQYSNKMNWSTCYWSDVARKVLLGNVCPKMSQAGNTALALQLANYAVNRIYQLSPLYEACHYGLDDPHDKETYNVILPFDEYRTTWTGPNYFDYSNRFFEMIDGVRADDAAAYAERIKKPATDLDRFLNERSYVDTDYIYDIVGTLYIREMNHEKASSWLAKVSSDYQNRTNIAKEGYFKLDPFRYQIDKKHFISDSNDYKLRFAQEMAQLDKIIHSDAETNRKASAKIRYAIGLRNSFGKCWYLTEFGYNLGDDSDYESIHSSWRTQSDKDNFKDNTYAQQAYKKVDALMNEAIAEFTDSEKAAQAQLEMMNYATLMKKHPQSKAAAYIRSRCDNYYDYELQKQ